MLNIFTLANGRLVQEEIESLEELSRFQPIWVGNTDFFDLSDEDNTVIFGVGAR